MAELTSDDLAVLFQQSLDTLADWWCQLNRYEWPAELPEQETEQERHTARREGRVTRAWSIMCWIHETVGEALISRRWNKDMSNSEFLDFYRGAYCRDKAAEERHDKRVRAKFST